MPRPRLQGSTSSWRRYYSDNRQQTRDNASLVLFGFATADADADADADAGADADVHLHLHVGVGVGVDGLYAVI